MKKLTSFDKKTALIDELNFLSLIKTPQQSYQFKLKTGKGY